jgi:hypothetical protein
MYELYEAKCNDCKQKFPTLHSEQALINIVEDHMMETGHTVVVKEWEF